MDKYCAILMEKIVLEEGVFCLYKPVCYILGEIKDNKFIKEDGKVIPSIETIENYENKYCFDNEIKLETLDEFYSNKIYKIEEQCEKYFEDYSRIVYIAEYNYKIGKLDIHEIDLENLKEEQINYEFFEKLDNKNDYLKMKENLNSLLKIYDEKYDVKDHDTRQKELEEVFKPKKTSMDINYLYEETKKVVKGQDKVIKDVLTSIKIDEFAKRPSERNRCLIVGNTGTGKTEIIRTIGNLIDRPFVRTDSTQITVAGYVGGTIEGNILLPLLSLANGNLEVAEHGIVALDEIDKKGSSSNDDVAGRGVLNSLLPFLDGTEFNVKYNNKVYRFNTSKLSVYALGAFTNVLEYKGKKTIGFNKKEDITSYTLEDFTKIGMMPSEFIGRFPILSIMNDLDLNTLIEILESSTNSPLLFYKEFFKQNYNIDFNYDDGFITEVAKKSIELNTGARSLKRIVEESINELRWQIMTSNSKYSEVILTEETINNPKIYKLK